MHSLRETGRAFGNRILSALSGEEQERFAPHLELVRLTPGRTIYDSGDLIRHAYFPKGGMLSLLTMTESGRLIEVGMIGSEGMVGLPIILRGDASPYRVVVQLAANALRVKAGVLREEFDRGGRLQNMLLKYTHTLLIQLSQSAACNRFHTVEQRLCRWLLLSRDRMQSDTLQLTQEFLSYMIGVPRTSVTGVAVALQREGLISYRRGRITILDRRGLEAASCECYRVVRTGLSQYMAA